MLRQDDGSEIDLTGDNELPQIHGRARERETGKACAWPTTRSTIARRASCRKSAPRSRAIYNGGVITAKTVHRKEVFRQGLEPIAGSTPNANGGAEA